MKKIIKILLIILAILIITNIILINIFLKMLGGV